MCFVIVSVGELYQSIRKNLVEISERVTTLLIGYACTVFQLCAGINTDFNVLVSVHNTF